MEIQLELSVKLKSAASLSHVIEFPRGNVGPEMKSGCGIR